MIGTSSKRPAFLRASLSILLAIALTVLGITAFMTLKSTYASATASTITGQLTEAQQQEIQDAIQAGGFGPATHSDTGLTNPDECTATIYYYEYTDYEDPDADMVEPGLRLLGTRTLTDLQEGQELQAWDYVADIPGHIFFDGWPFSLKVSTDPSNNTFEFFYFKLRTYEYTVNYYLMKGADLQADNWKDALAPEDVTFEKLGSETFYDQRYDQLVEGDAYEYKLDGMYVIDTYPAQIRVGSDTDNNVINVLYTPNSTTLPDMYDVKEVEDDASTPDSGTEGTLPDDETFDKDEIIDVLPDGDGSDTIIGDFVGGDGDQIVITDEMIQNPTEISKAEELIAAYQTGRESANLMQTGDKMGIAVWVIGGIAAIAIIALIISLATRKRKTK